MAVPNLTNTLGVDFIEFRDALSTHYERWRQVRAMVDGKHYVSFEVPAFYLSGFPDDKMLSRWLAQQARTYADEANTVQGESYGPR